MISTRFRRIALLDSFGFSVILADQFQISSRYTIPTVQDNATMTVTNSAEFRRQKSRMFWIRSLKLLRVFIEKFHYVTRKSLN